MVSRIEVFRSKGRQRREMRIFKKLPNYLELPLHQSVITRQENNLFSFLQITVSTLILQGNNNINEAENQIM